MTERVDWGAYSGVLTTDPGATATMLIGNTAWTDYVVSLRAGFPRNDNSLLIGVRAKDPNNMIGLECNGIICSWIIVKDGGRDNLPATSEMHLGILSLTVEGNTFTVVSDISSNQPNTMSLVLPPKYQGLFQGGGVLLQVTSAMEVDFIEIDPLP